MNIKLPDTNNAWKLTKNNWLIALSQKFILIFTAGSVLLVAIFWPKLPPQVPLWFSKPWGVEQLAPPLFLLVLPASSAVFFLLNYIVAKYVTSEYLVFAQILFLTSFIFSALSFMTVLKILLLII